MVSKLYINYIRTYVERDIRQISNVEDLVLFQKFMRLCAGRIGKPLNISGLASDCGVNAKTARRWLSLLEASYILFLVYPFYKKLGRRLVKSPKLFFADTGIACSLLRIRSPHEVSDSYLRGSLFENYIMADLCKQYYNLDIPPSVYFWRDQTHEVDCIIDEPKGPFALEIKAGETINTSYFEQLKYWSKLSGLPTTHNYVIYAGAEDQVRSAAQVLGWKSAGNIIEKLIG